MASKEDVARELALLKETIAMCAPTNQMYSDKEVYDRTSMPHGSALPHKSLLKPFERVGGRQTLIAPQHRGPSLAQVRANQAEFGAPALPYDLADDDEVKAAVQDVQRAEAAVGGAPHLPGAGVGALSRIGHGRKKDDNLAEMQAQAAAKALNKKLAAIEAKKRGDPPKKSRAHLKDHVGGLLHGFASDVPEDRMTEYQRATVLDEDTKAAFTVDCDRRHLRKKNSMTEYRERYVMIKKTLANK